MEEWVAAALLVAGGGCRAGRRAQGLGDRWLQPRGYPKGRRCGRAGAAGVWTGEDTEKCSQALREGAPSITEQNCLLRPGLPSVASLPPRSERDQACVVAGVGVRMSKGTCSKSPPIPKQVPTSLPQPPPPCCGGQVPVTEARAAPQRLGLLVGPGAPEALLLLGQEPCPASRGSGEHSCTLTPPTPADLRPAGRRPRAAHTVVDLYTGQCPAHPPQAPFPSP